MIYSLDGVVSHVLPHAIVLTVNGVGYLVHPPQRVVDQSVVDTQRALIIYHQVREDAHILYGFESTDDRQLFETLLSVSGIGPKAAIGILSHMERTDLIQAIQTKNVLLITQIPGIGKKTAERLIIELKDTPHLAMQTLAPSSHAPSPTMPLRDDGDDIMVALKQLGYQKDEIKRAFIKHAVALSAVDTIEDQIKLLLKHL